MSQFLKLQDLRKTDNSQLWIAGCSFSHGLGVMPNQRFGALLSNALDLDVSFLTLPGSSNAWAADQLLRSDIRKNDIVVWGLTGVGRFPYLDEDGVLHHINPQSFNKVSGIRRYFDEKILVSNHLMYSVITVINQVYNFLNKIGAKFILAVMPCNGPDHDIKLSNYVSTLDYAISMHEIHDPSFVDFGSDGRHPGPKQHELYAKNILMFFKNKYDENCSAHI